MCTVTYIPTGKDSYILTSNRDESPERGLGTIQPTQLERSGQNLLAPIDEKAKGTWLLTSTTGLTLCILNGAFEKHKHQPPYSYSRGLLPFKFLEYGNTDEFIKKIDLEGVEPFTLIIAEGGRHLSTLIWDEKEKHFSKLNPETPSIWSSATLYDHETKSYKEKIFDNFISKNSIENIDPIEFHTIGKENPIEPCIFIKREKVETVSTSMVTVNDVESTLFYQDYLKNNFNKLHLKTLL